MDKVAGLAIVTMSSAEVGMGTLSVAMMEVTVRWTKLRGRQSSRRA